MSPNNCDKCGHDRSMCDCKPDTFVQQVGGDHYFADFQHWDWVDAIDLHYLPATATKYVARWRKKNGLQDLEKTKTYLDKWVATGMKTFSRSNSIIQISHEMTERFVKSAKLGTDESDFMFSIALVAVSGSLVELKEAYTILERLMGEARALQGAVQGQGCPGSTLHPARGQGATPAPPYGRSERMAGQGPGASASTGSQINHPSPFGYQEGRE